MLRSPQQPPIIPTQAVKSSNIAAIGHDPATATLRVEFHSGQAYHYPDVSIAEHGAFLAADSYGRHFHQHFRHRKFARQ